MIARSTLSMQHKQVLSSRSYIDILRFRNNDAKKTRRRVGGFEVPKQLDADIISKSNRQPKTLNGSGFKDKVTSNNFNKTHFHGHSTHPYLKTFYINHTKPSNALKINQTATPAKTINVSY